MNNITLTLAPSSVGTILGALNALAQTCQAVLQDVNAQATAQIQAQQEPAQAQAQQEPDPTPAPAAEGPAAPTTE